MPNRKAYKKVGRAPRLDLSLPEILVTSPLKSARHKGKRLVKEDLSLPLIVVESVIRPRVSAPRKPSPHATLDDFNLFLKANKPAED